MDLDTTASDVDAPEATISETPATPDVAISAPPIPEPTDALDAEVITTEDADKDAVAVDGEAVAEVPAEESPTAEVATPEPVTFDVALESAAIIEQGKPILDKYALPQDVQAYVEALEAKAVNPELTEYSDYGGVDDVKTLLERQNYLDAIEEVEPGLYRPRTDKFIESVTDPTKRAWLKYDVINLPSDRYAGLNSAQEWVADNLRLEGESTEQTLARFDDTVLAMRSGATVVPDIPEFIHPTLQEAYSRLSKETRDELALLDLSDDYQKQIATRQINDLTLIQKGINAEKADAQRELAGRTFRQNELQTSVVTIQDNFYNAFESECVKDISTEVKFSTDPKLNSLMAVQNVALLRQAISPDKDGDIARTALKEAGLTFDHAQAQQLQKDIQKASVSLANAQALKDNQGNSLDKVALNKAVKEFETAVKKWQIFGKDFIGQQARLVSTGKADEVKTAAEKIKIETKARQVPKGTAEAATKTDRPSLYRNREAYISAAQEEAERTKAYR